MLGPFFVVSNNLASNLDLYSSHLLTYGYIGKAYTYSLGVLGQVWLELPPPAISENGMP